MRLYIDGHQWAGPAGASYNADVDLPAGLHEIRLEYYQNTGPAHVRLIWGLFNSAILVLRDRALMEVLAD